LFIPFVTDIQFRIACAVIPLVEKPVQVQPACFFQVFDFNDYTKSETRTPLPFITADKEKVAKFYNNYNKMLEEHLQFTTRLIAYLKNTYRME
jgi:hypothetical protein